MALILLGLGRSFANHANIAAIARIPVKKAIANSFRAFLLVRILKTCFGAILPRPLAGGTAGVKIQPRAPPFFLAEVAAAAGLFLSWVLVPELDGLDLTTRLFALLGLGFLAIKVLVLYLV